MPLKGQALTVQALLALWSLLEQETNRWPCANKTLFAEAGTNL